MKRKIAAIFAADIAGYSRLVAEDEEETLRRLKSYRAVTDDFIAKAGGRIFNTAGDAVLAEFSSAVEAVRCAIDIQESLRTRNMAYPPSRQMSFRIGITIGDVVEHDGDLLGDGVNIAARLEGLAEVGGICVSRAVHEQVANKLSVGFADIGAQDVKNIPTPVHAFRVTMKQGVLAPAWPASPQKAERARRPVWMWPVVVLAIALTAIGVRGFVNLKKTETQKATSEVASAPAPLIAPAPAPAAVAPAPAVPDQFNAATVLFVSDRNKMILAHEYAPAIGHKALAISSGPIGFAVNRETEEIAKTAALELCQKRADAAQPPRKCELYAVENAVVYARSRPPMPPVPWIPRDESVRTPFSADAVPMVRPDAKESIARVYGAGRSPKALAIGPRGQVYYYHGQDSMEDATRRTLELCGSNMGVPCAIVAIDDSFVVPIPSSHRITGIFRPDVSVAEAARREVSQRLASASAGWSAVSIGQKGSPGVAIDAASESDAVKAALDACATRDSACRVIAIGPFTVAPN